MLDIENQDPALEPEQQDTPQDAQNTPILPDIDELMKNPAIMDAIDQRVKQGITDALKGASPKRNTADTEAAERADFHKMDYKARVRLYNADPAKYKRLSGGTR